LPDHASGGVGHNFHNQCEEMFIVFDGEAEFTIDGAGGRGNRNRIGHQ
jgi:mannose-6-phosphate isomerase-like protein (cupin superfamily)